MRNMPKRLALFAIVLLLAVIGMFAAGWWKTERALDTRYTVNDPPLQMDRSAASLQRGQHLYTVLACSDCHGKQAQGQLAIDAGPVGKVIASNLTPAALAPRYGADGIAAAIRHGVAPDGRPLQVMPSEDFTHLSDADTAALVAYLQSLPPSDNNPGKTHITPFGRVLFLFGQLDLAQAARIDHRPRSRTSPASEATAEYGAYLAAACAGCHGRDFAGQHVPGTPPEFPDAANLTPHTDGLARWAVGDFRRALRTGRRPDGRELDKFMPWRAYSQMSDVEIDALWAYLSTLPPVASKK